MERKTLQIWLLLLCVGTGQGWATKRPNILFIFTDDQSHRTVSSYEDALPWAQTPNIDRLAQEGIRFKHAFAGPWCAPSRAMALTGRLLHGIEGLDFSQYPTIQRDPSLFRTWPEVFRKNGYTTAMIGKWHLGTDIAHDRLWDHSIIWNRLETEKAGDYFRNQKLRFDGGDYTPVPGHSTDNYTRFATDFIEREHQQPWILWLCYDAVHAPFTPADRHEGAYDGEPVPIPEDVYPPRPTKPHYMQDYSMLHPGPNGLPIDERRQMPLPDLVRKYHSGVLSLDEGIGNLLEILKVTGQLENTIIVYTSDQGLAMGHHGMTIKVAPYDDNIRVPFIVRLPGRTSQGSVVSHPVNAIDLIPTFFDYAGIDLPWTMHGNTLRPLLEDPGTNWDRPILQENFSKRFGHETDKGITGPSPNQSVDWWIFLRYGDFKYVRTLVPNEIEELYNINQDPRELRNLALEPDFQETLARYRRRMIEELKRTDAGLVQNMPRPKTL